ncbi:MAG: hypothetical protein RLZZ31_60 [Actinomycetota bacterium]|jgi:4-amino-4-deoxy-L-arabinose transferase-like glycosyltransferase
MPLGKYLSPLVSLAVESSAIDPLEPVSAERLTPSGPDVGADDLRSEKPGFELWLIAAGALLVGLITRVITRSELWLDEALSVNIATLPLSEIPEALKRDGHPPLYYVLLHFWTDIFGTSNLAVRSLSIVFGLLALAVGVVLGWRKAGRVGALLCVSVLSLSAFAVRYSSETRMYALVMLLVSLGWLILDDIFRRQKQGWWRYAALVVITSALLYSHYWSIWLLGAVGVVVLWLWRAQRFALRASGFKVLLAMAIGGLTFLPWLPTLAYQSANTATPWSTAVRPTSMLSMTIAFFVADNFGEVYLASGVFVVMLFLGACGYVISSRRTGLQLTTRKEWRAELIVVGLTFAFGAVVGIATGAAFAVRYAAVIFPMVMVMAALGLARFGQRWVRAVVLAGVCALFALGAGYNMGSRRTQMDQIVPTIEQNAQPGDVVVFCPDQLGPAGTRLLGDDLNVYVYPTFGDGRFVDWVDYAARNQAASPQNFAQELLQKSNGKPIFLVTAPTYRTLEGQCEALANALSTSRQRADLVADDGTRFFEHAGLQVFRVP